MKRQIKVMILIYMGLVLNLSTHLMAQDAPSETCKSTINRFMDTLQSGSGYGVAVEMNGASVWSNGNRFAFYGKFKTKLQHANSGNVSKRSLSKRFKVYFSDRSHFSKSKADEMTLNISDFSDIYIILNSWGNVRKNLHPTYCESFGHDKAIIQAIWSNNNSRTSSYAFTLKRVKI